MVDSAVSEPVRSGVCDQVCAIRCVQSGVCSQVCAIRCCAIICVQSGVVQSSVCGAPLWESTSAGYGRQAVYGDVALIACASALRRVHDA